MICTRFAVSKKFLLISLEVSSVHESVVHSQTVFSPLRGRLKSGDTMTRGLSVISHRLGACHGHAVTVAPLFVEDLAKQPAEFLSVFSKGSRVFFCFEKVGVWQKPLCRNGTILTYQLCGRRAAMLSLRSWLAGASQMSTCRLF